MSAEVFIAVMAAIAAVILAAMWLGWRARSRRDAGIDVGAAELAGAPLAAFPHAGYVSTTPAGAPFQRLAIPGLRYKGFADVTVRADGVEIAVTGEAPIGIPADRITGTGTAGGRVGKAVERDGLSLLRWRAAGSAVPELESGFRFTGPEEQLRFAEAVAAIAPHQTHTNASQEDA
ncbi:hypothetical protein MUN78_07580 [Leucobacter allii]|uniref:PH domain-containing protein n=1 Tax=Leucobacter allii TaxID=2932247 RepID=A0ABY4FQX5_9MICO|nr:hypothetical protein [Leucobacter allii]UOQ58672.1 hypothetical protein MUN78_07580 [Leucobacter allii]